SPSIARASSRRPCFASGRARLVVARLQLDAMALGQTVVERGRDGCREELRTHNACTIEHTGK
ncbi:MAG: hypothetical protein ACRETH_00090, partial [Steroidobacteraceae bacterium]